jgi:regulator of sigma E protease
MPLPTALPTGAAALFWGVITFSVLVVLHEGGHFLAARLFGVKVHEFMLGLPGPALRWRSKNGGVTYGVTAIPLGGYVRIAGMEPGAEDALLAQALGLLADRRRIDAEDLARDLRTDLQRATALLTTLEDYAVAGLEGDQYVALVTREEGESDDALLGRLRAHVFRGQPTWKRIVILAMGVLVNLVTALLIFTVTLSIWGLPTTTSKISSVQAGSGAAAAGVVPGDTVLAINGKHVSWDGLLAIVHASRPGVHVALTVRHNAASRTVVATLGTRPDGSALLGIAPTVVDIPMAPLAALGKSLEWTGLVFVSVGQFFNPHTFAASVSSARSVVGISYEVASAAKAGALQYSWLFALLSLSLGVLNILPIPPLDGGKVAVEIIESTIRRPIPRRISLTVSAVGATLLFSLIFYLMYADIVRYIVK